MDSLVFHNIEALAAARRAAFRLKSEKLTREKIVLLCRSLLQDGQPTAVLTDLWRRLTILDEDEKYYWIGTLYTLLLPAAERSAQAAYFTPPHLSHGVIELAKRHGFAPGAQTAVDPAAGGAAFLATLAGVMLDAGVGPEDILVRLKGYEIDPALAQLSEALVGDRLGRLVRRGSLVSVRDSLRVRPYRKYDLVIANPPYGRISPTELPDDRWRRVCHPGHVNKYALFVDLCFRLAKPDALVALVLPSSFVAGPLYGRLRSYIRSQGQVLALGAVPRRDDVFIDVAQDISVLLARAGAPHVTSSAITFGTQAKSFQMTSRTRLTEDSEGAWISQGSSLLSLGGATLTDYGAELRAGYFVWNREKKRMSKRRYSRFDVPLIWARNVCAGDFVFPQAKSREGIDFVRFREDSPAIIRQQAIVLQRTTNSSQPRRLIASRISPSVLRQWGGFVTENHTIVIKGPAISQLNEIVLLLNSAAVDERYRQLSGTASVSVSLLRTLDLPRPEHLRNCIERFGWTDQAVEQAYSLHVKEQLRARR